MLSGFSSGSHALAGRILELRAVVGNTFEHQGHGSFSLEKLLGRVSSIGAAEARTPISRRW
jgi:hypothetical protein